MLLTSRRAPFLPVPGWLRYATLVLRMLAVMLGTLAALHPAQAADTYLPPEQAFTFSATTVDAQTVAVTYTIADGYYMYRERFAFTARDATLGTPEFPAGKVKFDTTFEKNVETYRHAVTIRIPVTATGSYTLLATGQGCADQGLCYAPMASEVGLSVNGSRLDTLLHALTAPAATSQSAAPAPSASAGAPQINRAPAGSFPVLSTAPAAPTTGSQSSRLQSTLQSGSLLAIIPLFLLLGLGLAFTPCVLPMLPILSSIIVGEGSAVSRRRGFVLALTYSLGMALVYTALGVAAGLAGEGLAATLQNPWVVSAFALLMVALSLSMFGWYNLEVPAAVQQRLTQVSQHQRGGKIAGVFIMGALSALIVGPCVAAPLAGALVYISQTRDVFIGGCALFALAMGMSVPLLLLGISAGSLLPRAGAWMESIKRCFGVLMLAVALWMVSPFIPVTMQMAAWAALGTGAGAAVLWSGIRAWPVKAAGLAITLLGLLQLAGLATGGRDVLHPLAHLQGARAQHLVFARIKSDQDLNRILVATGGKTVLLDFYADWCVSCKEMEQSTFTDAAIIGQLRNTITLQADVTANDAQDRALLKRFGLFGPPGIILFHASGAEIADSRIIGYQDGAQFSHSLSLLVP